MRNWASLMRSRMVVSFALLLCMAATSASSQTPPTERTRPGASAPMAATPPAPTLAAFALTLDSISSGPGTPPNGRPQGALAGVSTALSALRATTAVSMQQQLPPPPSGDFEPPAPAGMPASPNAATDAAQSAGGAAKNVVGEAVAEAKSAVEDATKAAGKDAVKEAADKAKKELGLLLRRKKP